MKKKISVTIGIPAFNEEKNIVNLLNSVITQSRKNFTLEKVFVNCDGSTDTTILQVKEFSKKHPEIQLIEGKKRLGKAYRLNQLYKLNKSDIYITFDADVVLGSKNVIEEVVSKFKNENVGLVGGCNLPSSPKGFLEKVAVTWILLWFEIRRDLHNGITIHNHLGCISAMSRELADQVKIPNSAISDEDYIYFTALKLGYKFRFAKKAVVYYKAANNLKDYFIQSSRVLSAKDKIAFLFGEWVYSYYKVPLTKKIMGLFRMIKKDPLFLFLAIIFQVQIIIFTKLFQKNKSYINWKIAYSTKEIIAI